MKPFTENTPTTDKLIMELEQTIRWMFVKSLTKNQLNPKNLIK